MSEDHDRDRIDRMLAVPTIRDLVGALAGQHTADVSEHLVDDSTVFAFRFEKRAAPVGKLTAAISIEDVLATALPERTISPIVRPSDEAIERHGQLDHDLAHEAPVYAKSCRR
ncbi:MAG TPA: hypothetical protein VGI70_21805 [Polyangiales bacterium]|jgi:hypothetical protein